MIYLGADHGGFKLKEKIKQWLSEWKLPYEDLGAHKLDPEDDYPQFAFTVAEKVAQADDMTQAWEKRAKGILVCRSAAGMVIAANKVKGNTITEKIVKVFMMSFKRKPINDSFVS